MAKPIVRSDLVAAVSDAFDISREGLKGKDAEHSWALRAVAFGLVLKGLLEEGVRLGKSP